MEIQVKTQDMFKMIKVVKKIGILNKLKDIFTSVKGQEKMSEKEIEAMQESVGVDIITEIIGNLDLAEVEIYDLVASCSGKKAKDIAGQDPLITMEVLEAIVKSPVFKSFLAYFSK